jgi:hypothetical protein
MTVSDRLDRAEKALRCAARQLLRAKTPEEMHRAEGLLCDAARELRDEVQQWLNMIDRDLACHDYDCTEKPL